MSTRIITGKARLSFPHLFEPWAAKQSDPPKYSTMVLIPKSDTATIEKMRAAEEEIKATKSAVWGGKVPKHLKSSLHDGDVETEKYDPEDWPERHGHFYITPNSNVQYKPGVVDRALNPILDRSEVYSGVYAKVSMTAFAYNTSGNLGIGFGLNNVQILGGGENLGGGVSAASEFDALDDDEEAASLL